MSVHFSSEKQTWETPQYFFDKVNSVFNFTLDACAEDTTAKVSNYFTVEDDALTKDWKGVVWCNPPYGREQVKFVEKAYTESVKNSCIVVMLIPARPETKIKRAEFVCRKIRYHIFFINDLYFCKVKFSDVHNTPFQ